MISLSNKVFYQRSAIGNGCTGRYPRCSGALVNGKIYRYIVRFPQTCPVIFAFSLVATVRLSLPQEAWLSGRVPRHSSILICAGTLFIRLQQAQEWRWCVRSDSYCIKSLFVCLVSNNGTNFRVYFYTQRHDGCGVSHSRWSELASDSTSALDDAIVSNRYAVFAAFDINGIHTIIKIITAMINMIQIHFRFAFWCFFAPSSCLIPFSM